LCENGSRSEPTITNATTLPDGKWHVMYRFMACTYTTSYSECVEYSHQLKLLLQISYIWTIHILSARSHTSTQTLCHMFTCGWTLAVLSCGVCCISWHTLLFIRLIYNLHLCFQHEYEGRILSLHISSKCHVVYLNKAVTVNYTTRIIVIIFSCICSKRGQKFVSIYKSATQEPVGIFNDFWYLCCYTEESWYITL
jgi:hypothetical protein